MAKNLEIYKCEICGNIVEVLQGAAGKLNCCGKPMVLLAENSVDAAKEKHVPVIEKATGGYLVKVGSVAHPMTAEHLIQWIELLAGDSLFRRVLNPGDAPEAYFATDAENPSARAYCNLHGLWKA